MIDPAWLGLLEELLEDGRPVSFDELVMALPPEGVSYDELASWLPRARTAGLLRPAEPSDPQAPQQYRVTPLAEALVRRSSGRGPGAAA